MNGSGRLARGAACRDGRVEEISVAQGSSCRAGMLEDVGAGDREVERRNARRGQDGVAGLRDLGFQQGENIGLVVRLAMDELGVDGLGQRQNALVQVVAQVRVYEASVARQRAQPHEAVELDAEGY